MRKLLLLFLFLFCSSTAFAQAAPQVTLGWAYVDTDITKWGVTGFQTQRKAESCAGTALSFANLAVVAPTLRAYVDPAVVLGGTYCYRVFALAPVTLDNAQGNSGFGNLAEKHVPLGPPPVPTNLIVTLVQALVDALETFKTGLLNLK